MLVDDGAPSEEMQEIFEKEMGLSLKLPQHFVSFHISGLSVIHINFYVDSKAQLIQIVALKMKAMDGSLGDWIKSDNSSSTENRIIGIVRISDLSICTRMALKVMLILNLTTFYIVTTGRLDSVD